MFSGPGVTVLVMPCEAETLLPLRDSAANYVRCTVILLRMTKPLSIFGVTPPHAAVLPRHLHNASPSIRAGSVLLLDSFQAVRSPITAHPRWLK